MVDPEVARAISDAARIVRAGSRRAGLELDELVQVGWERVLRYLGRETTNAGLAFVCAKQGMLMHIKHEWKRGMGFRFGGAGRSYDPRFASLEREDVSCWDQWRRFSLPIEEMIDAKRALLGMQLREAVAWYSHHWLGAELGELTDEFGVTEGRIRQYCASARAKLAAMWAGEGFETEAEREQREQRQRNARDAQRAAANQRMLAERSRRRADLRSRGVRGAELRRAAQSATRYADAVRRAEARA